MPPPLPLIPVTMHLTWAEIMRITNTRRDPQYIARKAADAVMSVSATLTEMFPDGQPDVEALQAFIDQL